MFRLPQEKIEVAATEVPTQRDPEIGVLQAVFEFYEQPGPPPEEAVADEGVVASVDEISVDENSVDENPDEVVIRQPVLGPQQRAVLDFESRRFKNPGRKEQAIREEFDISPTQFFQKVNALLDDPAALAYNPTLVARLRRIREARQQARH